MALHDIMLAGAAIVPFALAYAGGLAYAHLKERRFQEACKRLDNERPRIVR